MTQSFRDYCILNENNISNAAIWFMAIEFFQIYVYHMYLKTLIINLIIFVTFKYNHIEVNTADYIKILVRLRTGHNLIPYHRPRISITNATRRNLYKSHDRSKIVNYLRNG